MKNQILIAMMAAVIFFMIVWNNALRIEIGDAKAMNLVYSGQIKKTIDDKGVLTAEVKDLRLSNQKQLRKMTALTMEQARLKEMADKYKRMYSAVSLTALVRSQGSSPTTVFQTDTITQNDSVFFYPTYRTQITTEYRTGTITANKDSIDYDIREIVPLDMAQSMAGKWYKRKTATLTITSKNPSVDITGASSYSLQEPRRRIVFGPQVGYGTSNGKDFRIYFGAGLTFRII